MSIGYDMIVLRGNMYYLKLTRKEKWELVIKYVDFKKTGETGLAMG